MFAMIAVYTVGLILALGHFRALGIIIHCPQKEIELQYSCMPYRLEGPQHICLVEFQRQIPQAHNNYSYSQSNSSSCKLS